MRKVEVYSRLHEHPWAMKKEGEGVFHQFGVDYEELEGGPGNYSTAIVEMQDGTVKNIPVGLIKFIKDEETININEYKILE